MVVVPTDTHVELTYGNTAIDIGAWLVTLLGVIGVVALALLPPVRMPTPRPRPAPPADGGDGGEEAGAGADEDEPAPPPPPREPAPTG
jgi:hypothetical protein